MRNYQIMRYLLIVCWIIGNMPSGWAAEGGSTYTQRPDDPEAFYFTPENYGFKADGKSDVTDALQEAINQVKREKNFGILFLPEGNYRISKTIQIPSSIRLIGYGKKRPVIYLAAYHTLSDLMTISLPTYSVLLTLLKKEITCGTSASSSGLE